MNYITDPKEIEKRSFEIISKNIDEMKFEKRELMIVKRVIHATADFDFAHIIKISDGAIDAGLKALKEGCTIVTDTKMAEAGINKKALKSIGASVKCYIDMPQVEELSKTYAITRSMASMVIASKDGRNKIFAIGNAPTALFKLCELVNSGEVMPYLIIGVPVGFVGAQEAKEEVKKLGVPYIITEGRKGGSTIAAAIVNALLYMMGD
ncbi:Precorrin-8X methylmutase [Thermoanaerobacter mathranii subsp. mathranii str. A3]|jgi:precorrin-8X/cobalt-precorrin-8 methylmutase|uniref:Precorrin-8X methylmutase n=1 Tax=Thermoanaerobacter mathranii subsp. mathranii (strain DSM 11426 / CCUG 53645 / CIP 108742 / A3) TaxID=583358 RepID=A0ABM5LN70_THEM3|nr:precorrin-8X methylmutase [Thermoanaerobacter mathranii]ADH60194.1 Precorrin-8X methylmutase [Thermoanaerobacter mathranii subsp. mathranii str. A3]MDI3530097.1 precorrin-8X/cobalt-precorrin-8 methylmutase [Thermoanaerobacter sp.]